MTEDAAVRRHLPLVRHVIRRMGLPPHLDRDDLMQAGSIGLLKSVREFQPEKGRFTTFAGQKIRWAVIEELRRQDHLSRSQRAKVDPDDIRYAAPVSLDAPARRDSSTPLSGYVACQSGRSATADDLACNIDLQRAMSCLDPREVAIVSCHALDIPQKDIALKLGVSRSRVGQILEGAVDMLRCRLLPRSSPDPLTVRAIHPKVPA